MSMITIHRRRRNTRRESRSFGRPAGDERLQPPHEEIAKLAYELYQKRGGANGQDWEDWFLAEAALQQGESRCQVRCQD